MDPDTSSSRGRFKHVLPPPGGAGDVGEDEEGKEGAGGGMDALPNDRGFYEREWSGSGRDDSRVYGSLAEEKKVKEGNGGGRPATNLNPNSKPKPKPKPKSESPSQLPGDKPKIPIPAPPPKALNKPPKAPNPPKTPKPPKPKSNPIPPKHPPPPPPSYPNPPPPTGHVPFTGNGHHDDASSAATHHNEQCIHPHGIDRLRCNKPDAVVGTLLVVVALLALPFLVWVGWRRCRGKGRGGKGGEGEVELGRIRGGEGEAHCDSPVGMGRQVELGGSGERGVGDERLCAGVVMAGMGDEEEGMAATVECESEGAGGVDSGESQLYHSCEEEANGSMEGEMGGETEMEGTCERDREPSRGRRRDRRRDWRGHQQQSCGNSGKRRENSVLSEGMIRTALVGLKVVGGERGR